MAYIKKIWKDYPDATTPITAEDLNNIEDELETVTNELETVTTNINNIEDELETLDKAISTKPSLIVGNGASNVSNSETGASAVNLTTIPLTQKIKVGDKLSIVDGKILVGSGVEQVKISGQIYCTTNITSGDILRLFIVKNSTSVIYRSMLRVLGTYQMITGTTTIEEVVEGDVLELKFNNADRTGTTCSGGNDTFLTVEVIE